MDKEVVLNKLENLRRCVARVEAKRPSSLPELIDDFRDYARSVVNYMDRLD